VDHAGRSALLWTAPTGASLRTIALLLERGADPSLTSRLDAMIHNDDDDDDEEEENNTLGTGASFLMKASSFGYNQIIRLLLLHNRGRCVGSMIG
jgi:ankyrin repeat protein